MNGLTDLEEREYLRRAKILYRNWCKKTGYIHSQPAEGLCEIIRKDRDWYVILKNCNGILAEMEITAPNGRLKMRDLNEVVA